MSETVYLSLGENLDGEAFTEARAEGEFNSVQDFIDRLQQPLEESELSVTTNYFRAYGQVIQGDLLLNLDTLIYRDESGKTSVISRTLGLF
jgi:type II secretory pathway component PulK